jgi:DNA-binding GntR family transcriptional regulator
MCSRRIVRHVEGGLAAIGVASEQVDDVPAACLGGAAVRCIAASRRCIVSPKAARAVTAGRRAARIIGSCQSCNRSPVSSTPRSTQRPVAGRLAVVPEAAKGEDRRQADGTAFMGLRPVAGHSWRLSVPGSCISAKADSVSIAMGQHWIGRILVSDTNYHVARIAAPLRQQVIHSIRTAIAVGHFKPGDRLTERDLCEMTGVSRTLIREALRQLESEALITVVPHRGPIVTRLSVEQAEEIYQVRRELESLACELFAERATADDLKSIKASLKRLKAVLVSGSPTERLSAKNEFYDCLLQGAGNQTLAQSLSVLNSRIMVLRATSLQVQGRSRASIAELTVLVNALEARDPALARQLSRRHVDNAARSAIEIMRGVAKTA